MNAFEGVDFPECWGKIGARFKEEVQREELLQEVVFGQDMEMLK